MKTLKDLKSILKLGQPVKIQPTNIKLGILNFATGVVNEYDFTAVSVWKSPYGSDFYGENDYKRQVCYVAGTIHYESGASYIHDGEKLTYTDDKYLDKLWHAVSGE